MTTTVSEWLCKCGQPMNDERLPVEMRQPCPVCGSVARSANVMIAETITVSAYLKTHTKHREGGRKVVHEIIEGDDYHRKTAKWNLMRDYLTAQTIGMKKHFGIEAPVK
jgi:hypothetical protein